MSPSLGRATHPDPIAVRATMWGRSRPRLPRMLIAASTVKDTPAHVRRFVAGNLGGGLDHLVVFLDQPGAPGQEEVAALLDEHPHVTCVRAGPGWWGQHRPRGLNERQCTNATVVAHLLADVGPSWVFHVDGDEVVRLDRDVLAAVPRGVAAVRLAPREAVSKPVWEGEPTLFKEPLDEADLRLLHALGAIAEPDNRAYFHGHLQGKTGVRPSAATWLGLHRALTASGDPVETHDDERLELFHYESYSGDEFVRKWSEMTTSGPRASFRAGRAAVADAVRSVLEKDLDPEVTRRLLLRLHAHTTADDAGLLSDLGLVVETDPLAGTHEPQPLPAPVLTHLREGLEALRGADKGRFYAGSSARRSAADGDAGDKRADGRGRRGLLGRSRPT
jgi:hypothetical protein